GLDRKARDAGRKLVAEMETDLAEHRVARHDEAVFERAAAQLVAEVAQGLRRLRQWDLAPRRKYRVHVGVRLQGDRCGYGLEGRTGRINLAPRPSEQRIRGFGVHELPRVGRGIRVVRREQIRVERWIRIHRDNPAGLYVEHD